MFGRRYLLLFPPKVTLFISGIRNSKVKVVLVKPVCLSKLELKKFINAGFKLFNVFNPVVPGVH